MATLTSGDLFADVARIRIDLSKPSDRPGADRVSFGSGRLIGHNLVLTARHVLEDESGAVFPEQGWEVRLLRDLVDGEWHDKPISARVVWRGRDKLDLALLELAPKGDPGPAYSPNEGIRLRLGRYDSVMDLDQVWVAGFPWAARVTADVAKEYGTPAKLRKAEKGKLYALTVSTENAPPAGEDWRGLSGACVVLKQRDTIWLLGAVQQVPRGFGPEMLNVASIEQAWEDRDFKGFIERYCKLDSPNIEALEKRPGAYAVVGVEAFNASRDLFADAASKSFYGRDRDLKKLDQTVATHDRGIILMWAEAGLGKSRLVARWTDDCALDPSKTVVRHAFSVRKPQSSTHAAMVDSLIHQAAIALGAEELGEGDPGDARIRADRLAALLARDQPNGMRLIVAIDGLDEAAERVEPWSTKLGQGVHTLITCRAEPGETHNALRSWRERAEGVSSNDAAPITELVLEPLDARALAAWLTAHEHKEFAATDPLVAQMLRASEGIPLFADLMIPQAIEWLRAGSTNAFPESFAKYAHAKVQELLDRAYSTEIKANLREGVLSLFAVLTKAKAPLPSSWIKTFLAKPPRGLAGATLDVLDPRTDRWLWRRDEGIGFVHPRLALVFARVLPDFGVDIEAIEKELVDACSEAWGSAKKPPLNTYALAWLPAHLMEQKRLDEAASLLGNGAFHLAPLIASPTETTARKTALETINLDHQHGGNPALTEWRRFWSETEAVLVNGLIHAQRLGVEPARMFAQIAHDRFGPDATVFRPLVDVLPKSQCDAPRLAHPCGFSHPSLRREIFDAHVGLVGGVLALDDRLVSWGADGAIRFWDRDGAARPGGDSKAHVGRVEGLLALDDRLVSWGADGAIRFWDRDGAARPGGDSKAHTGLLGVRGVLALDDRLVSWGADGAIRFWDWDGAARPGGNSKAHAGLLLGVRGVLALDDRLVSWGADGAIRFWDRDGAARPGGDSKAHTGLLGVGGVLALDDRLVSWGADGAIRFWDRDGAARPGGDSKAHTGLLGVGGVLALNDRLVSWGTGGAIRFWDRHGAARPGGDSKAHTGLLGVRGVLALDDRLVSWGADGAIRFWDRDGAARPGGDPNAHTGSLGVGGVLALDDRLVSWGADGAIRFWDRDGAARPGGDPNAHTGSLGVGGVLALDDRLVSWGADGAIRFWDRDGAARPGGDPATQWVGGMLALNDRLVSWGTGGAIRFWDRDGAARPGGDPNAHVGGVGGVLALDDRLVSWGADGAIRFWDRDGAARPGGDPNAQVGGVGGVLALDDRLVSWGADGAIRFWDRDGAARPGGDPNAHVGGVGGVLALDDRLVSWGADGAIRFWDRDGVARPGGDPKAHVGGGVWGVLALDDRLVSWGADGSIRFWDRDGAVRSGGVPKAHVRGVGGVLALDDRLVSWGADGAIRFWDRDGVARPGGDPKAHVESMFLGVWGVPALDVRLVSWGVDGAIRFWDQDGDTRPGGDPKAHGVRGMLAGGVGGVLALGDRLVSWGGDGAIRFWDRHGAVRPGGDSNAHVGGVGGVLALDDRLVSWGKDGAIRFWRRQGQLSAAAWLAPARLQLVTVLDGELWVGLLGCPFRLLPPARAEVHKF